jgi:RNA ligase
MRNIEKIKSNKEEIEAIKHLFPSYPKTAYLHFETDAKLKDSEETDDVFLQWDKIYLEIDKMTPHKKVSVLIQEKMDGSNAGMMFDQDKIGSKDGHIHVRNRDHILRKNYLVNKDSSAKVQFLPFFNEAHARQKSLAKLNKECDQIVGVFGEWMYALHSTLYDELPSTFFAFDIWLTRDKKFLDPVQAHQMLLEAGFEVPHTKLAVSSLPLSELEATVKASLQDHHTNDWKSFYNSESKDKSEGLYIKIGNPEAHFLISRFKMVRADYQSNLYWDEKKISRQKIR